MIDPHNIALITCIDTNKKIIGEKNTFEYRLFEYEAINCYTHWRKNAGWLKDINIYSLNSKGHIISKQCIDKLRKLNVTYIEKYNDFICKNNIDFIDKLYAQSFFEFNNNIKEQYLIYVDLDVALMNKFPDFIFDQIEQGKIILAKHDVINKNICSLDFLNRYINIHDKLNGNCYNAYLVIEDKKQYFFNTLYKMIFKPQYYDFYNTYASFKTQTNKTDYYLFEETLYDYIWYENIFKDRIYNLNTSYLEKNIFIHKHLNMLDIIKYTK